METKYLTVTKAVHLEQISGFLSNYKGPTNEVHIITDRKPEHISQDKMLEHYNGEFTEYLKQLGKINQEREILISKFLNHKS